jgi:hypothetical protein
MPKKEIWRFTDEDDGEVSLDYAWSYATKWDNIDKSPVLSLEEVADFSDHEAEGRNNGSYVGAHRILAALLHRKLGREQATEVMREIAEYGGLDGMSGIGGEPDAFADFGIKDDGGEWKLEDGSDGIDG